MFINELFVVGFIGDKKQEASKYDRPSGRALHNNVHIYIEYTDKLKYMRKRDIYRDRKRRHDIYSHTHRPLPPFRLDEPLTKSPVKCHRFISLLCLEALFVPSTYSLIFVSLELMLFMSSFHSKTLCNLF